MRIATALLLAMILPSTLDAQAAPASSGLLLGVQDCAWDWCGRRSTYWIVREGDRVRVAARGDGLLVPRKDGFWWIDAESGSNAYGEPEPDEGVPCDTAQVDTSAAPGDPVDPAMEESDPRPGMFWAARAGTRGESRQYSLSSGGNGSLWLDWVGSDWLAFTEQSVDAREHVHTSYGILRVDALLQGADDALYDFDLTDPSWQRAEESCLVLLRGERADPDALEPEWSGFWTVRRGPTYWSVRRAYRPSFAYDDYIGTCAVPRELTSPMIGYDRVTIPWPAIKNVLPGATTAFQAPDGGLLLVQEDSTWHVFLPRDGRPGPVAARFRIGGRPVMAQWAVGAHASRWTREVSALLEKGPPRFRRDDR